MKRADPKYNGEFTPYIETLPFDNCFNFTVNYDEETIDLLAGSHRVQFETAVRKLNVKKEYNRLIKGVNELK